MRGPSCVISGVGVVLVLSTLPAGAQSRRAAPIVELTAGYVGFVDESQIPHLLAGGSARVFVLSGMAFGPEILFMRGPGSDRDVALMGAATFDLLAEGDTLRRIVPYLKFGGGIMRHSGGPYQRSRYAYGPFLSFGGGARIAVQRLFVAPEVLFGMEPHLRVSVSIGWRPGR